VLEVTYVYLAMFLKIFFEKKKRKEKVGFVGLGANETFSETYSAVLLAVCYITEGLAIDSENLGSSTPPDEVSQNKHLASSLAVLDPSVTTLKSETSVIFVASRCQLKYGPFDVRSTFGIIPQLNMCPTGLLVTDNIFYPSK